jgi:hypothetical protein
MGWWRERRADTLVELKRRRGARLEDLPMRVESAGVARVAWGL